LNVEGTTRVVQGAESAIGAEISTAWREGDDLINIAYLWVAERYERLPDPRPAVVADEWSWLEMEIDRAYDTRDLDQLRTAIRAWAKFAVEQFKRHPVKTTLTPAPSLFTLGRSGQDRGAWGDG
jgi:hypothetical protein